MNTSPEAYAMNELAQQLKMNGPSLAKLAQIAQYMPIIEMNALSQICTNQQLSEETRNLATARLEAIVQQTYGQMYCNDNAKKFK